MRNLRSQGSLSGKDMDGRQYPIPEEATNPIRDNRLNRIAELLHLRKSGMESAATSQKIENQTMPIEQTQNPGGEKLG